MIDRTNKTHPGADARQEAPKTITVVGVGNIGLYLIGLLARMPSVGRVTVIDRDRYELSNLDSQDILPSDVGKAKAAVAARRLTRIHPSMRVVAIANDVQYVPLGRLRADVILACLDSKAARCIVNQSAWRLGVPWIDAGVNAADGLWAGVTVYVPGEGRPCLECAWSELDYRRMEQSHPCDEGAISARSSGSTAALGMLAAARQAMEARKLLAGDTDHLLAGRRVLIDGQANSHTVTAFRANPDCRFDHQTWPIESAPVDAGGTIGQACELAGAGVAGRSPVTIGMEGRPFVTAVQCLECGQSREILRLRGRLRRTDQVCPSCGGKAAPVGFRMQDRLDAAASRSGVRRRSLRSVGVRDGDVLICNCNGHTRYYEIGATTGDAGHGR